MREQTIQILIDDDSTRHSLWHLVSDCYETITGDRVGTADLYMVGDCTLQACADRLRAQKRKADPVFCPVVLVQRRAARIEKETLAIEESELVDQVLTTQLEESVVSRTLENLLARRNNTRKLVRKTAEIERQERQLDALNRLVRHDIRNDLQVILANSEVLATRYDDDKCERIIDGVQRAIRRTNEARELTQAIRDTGESLEPVALATVLSEEIRETQQQYQQASVTVRGDIPRVSVRADDTLSSVFRNLLQNGITHNHRSTPQLTVTGKDEGETVAVQIADNGPGIPPEEREQIFEGGWKGTESDGTGLGLSLVQALVERYGGDIDVEPNQPTGSIFTVRFPKATTGPVVGK